MGWVRIFKICIGGRQGWVIGKADRARVWVCEGREKEGGWLMKKGHHTKIGKAQGGGIGKVREGVERKKM